MEVLQILIRLKIISKVWIYKSPTITAEDLIEGATVGENGPTITLPEGGTYIEYTIGIKLGTLNAYASDAEKGHLILKHKE